MEGGPGLASRGDVLTWIEADWALVLEVFNGGGGVLHPARLTDLKVGHDDEMEAFRKVNFNDRLAGSVTGEQISVRSYADIGRMSLRLMILLKVRTAGTAVPLRTSITSFISQSVPEIRLPKESR